MATGDVGAARTARSSTTLAQPRSSFLSIPIIAMATASSRNPFLSPQGTGASSTTHGPSIHSAFADLNLGHEQPALLTPQHTAASTTSNNPFLDRPLLPSAATRPQQHPSESSSGRSLSVQELAELEGTAVAVTKRETAPRPAPVSSAPSGSAQQRPVSPQVEVDAPAVAYSTPNVSSSYVSSSQARRVAEGNEDFRGACAPAAAAGSWHLHC